MQIKTPRLTLRPWQESDLEPFAKINSDEKVCQFLPSTLSRKQSDQLAQKIIDHQNKYGFCFFAVQLNETREFIGLTGLQHVNFDAHFTPAVEIGWRLSSGHWNKGYATEAAKVVLSFGFDELGLEEIVSFTTEENMASRRVMEKIGMVRDEQGDFNHPKLDEGHPLVRHVLYRMHK